MKRWISLVLALALCLACLGGTAMAAEGGWRHDAAGWWYAEEESWPASEWRLIDGAWYFFDDGGYMVTGWQLVDGAWYYFGGSGAMVTGWLYDGGVWYYLKGSGAMTMGWGYIDGTWYWFGLNGAMATGWRYLSGVWYFFEPSGAMAEGWRLIYGSWYFFDENGAMVTGWLETGQERYYMLPSGAMAVGWQRLEDTLVYFDDGGLLCPEGYVPGAYGDTSVYCPGLADSMLEEIRAAVLAFLQDHYDPAATDYEKVKLAHDYLVNTVEYEGYSEHNDARVSTAWGSLVGKKANCTGYSRGMKALCDAMGIGCELVSMTTYLHYWNVVQVDGGWYHVDVQYNDDGGKYGTFLCSDETAAAKDYHWDTSLVPACPEDYPLPEKPVLSDVS